MSFWTRLFGLSLRSRSGKEKSGEFGIPIDGATAILGIPACLAVLQGIRDRLTDIGRDQKVALVDDVVRRFLLFVGHLPASDGYHHAAPWGLLDHSLEVALRALTRSLEMRFSEDGSSDPGREYDLLPRWRYTAFLFGLLHDIGKIAQVRVDAGQGAVWNPFVESLADFMIRYSAWPPEPVEMAVEWLPKRGLETHEMHNPFFLGRILTREVAEYLGPVLSMALERKTAAAQMLAAVISAADQESVVANRRTRLVEPDVAQGSTSIADYFPAALQRALENGSVTTNAVDADAFVGERYLAVRYPATILKIMGIIRERWKEDARVAGLQVSEAGVKAFVRDLALRQIIFRDRESATWKLKATVAIDGIESKTFLLLVKKEILETDTFRPFTGRIWFYSMVDLSPVAIDDFSVADAPSPAAPPSKLPEVAESEPAPIPAMIDPDQLVEKIRDLVARRKIPTNVAQGLVYVTPEITYLVWPRAFAVIREAMGLPFNPFEDKRPYYAALSQIPFVERDERGSVIYSIKFRPDAPGICRMVRMQTEGLFPDKKMLADVGIWAEGHLIQLAPPEAHIERRVGA